MVHMITTQQWNRFWEINCTCMDSHATVEDNCQNESMLITDINWNWNNSFLWWPFVTTNGIIRGIIPSIKAATRYHYNNLYLTYSLTSCRLSFIRFNVYVVSYQYCGYKTVVRSPFTHTRIRHNLYIETTTWNRNGILIVCNFDRTSSNSGVYMHIHVWLSRCHANSPLTFASNAHIIYTVIIAVRVLCSFERWLIYFDSILHLPTVL